jgi:hypothetical protein
MKKITMLMMSLCSVVVIAQQKTTGVINASNNLTASLTLDSATQLVVLTLTGPNDRWFALQFGSFEAGMQTGTDVVYWNGTTLVDASQNGTGQAPSIDNSNDWIQISNTNNAPSNGVRTLVYSRAFSTGDPSDYTFDFANDNIDLAWARMFSASFEMGFHGGANRGVLLNTPFTTLGVEDFSLNTTQVFPNPCQGAFKITTKTPLKKVAIYSQTGALVKSIDTANLLSQTDVNVDGLQVGVYLIELQNETEKSWKKLIVQ